MKVHFAGMERITHAVSLFEFAHIRNGLFTVFPFIADKFGIKAIKYQSGKTENEVVEYLKQFDHMIMDSGLFTLMFGAHAAKRDRKFMFRWFDELVSFVHRTGYKGAVVEADCQNILGVKEAWELRRELKNQLPHHELINVFHPVDGVKGFHKLIEFSDYLAFSIPELRHRLGGQMVSHVRQLTQFAKQAKPALKIHLLGCTQSTLMKACSYCDSCDSTSWQKVNRFGRIDLIHKGKMVSVTRTQAETQTKKLRPMVTKRFKELNMPMTKIVYYENYAVAALHTKHRYEKYAGSQQ